MGYSLDFRRRLFAVKSSENLSVAEVGRRFKVSDRTIFRWMNRIEPMTTRNKPATKIDMSSLAEDVKKHPDLFQYERAAKFGVSQSCISYALKRLDITNKKNVVSSKISPRSTP